MTRRRRAQIHDIGHSDDATRESSPDERSHRERTTKPVTSTPT